MGFTVDYYKNFASVTKLASIGTILAVTTLNDLPINIFYFYSTFLNQQLDDNGEVFVEQLFGYEESHPKKYYIKFKK